MSIRGDKRLMGRAISLAHMNHGLTGKNPSVGCCIVDAEGYVTGEGVTGVGGRPHAEQIALEMAGEHARGGTAYVTLEPCRERSTDETACSQCLIDAGIARVVIAVKDAHPQGAGGIERLKEAGIRVDVGIKGHIAEPLYTHFFSTIAGPTSD